MNLENIHKLATKEDANHIHKFLGIICLTNFAYQYGHIWLYGHTDLSHNRGLCLLFVHGALSVSSLIFHIPAIRNRTAPMIYPEFRLHSIIFAMRSVVCFYLAYYDFGVLYKMAVCMITMHLADIATDVCRPSAASATTTMRNMPFDKEDVDERVQEKIIVFHSKMQVAATLYMLGNTDSTFMPLGPIQLSAFMMTLVRKNIITSTMWHRMYSLLLMANIACYYSAPMSYVIPHLMSFYLFIDLRFKPGTNKYACWTFVFFLFYVIQYWLQMHNMDDYLEPRDEWLVKQAIVFIYLHKCYNYVL